MKVLKNMGIGLLLLMLISIGFMACATMRKSDKQMKQYMQKNQVKFDIVSGTYDGKPFRYLIHNDGIKPLLVFIHGAPGSSSAFLSIFKNKEVLSNYNVMVPDRPGYGFTDYGNYNDIGKQAAFLTYLLSRYSDSMPFVLIGHSYGAPIAAKLAMENNARVKGVVMVGGAINLFDEKYFFMGKLAYWPATRWLFSKAIQVSADEKYDHENQLKQIQNDWKNIKTPILLIHGDKDWLVPFKNTEFAVKNIESKYLKIYRWENESHFIPFTKSNEMMKIILDWINESVEQKKQ